MRKRAAEKGKREWGTGEAAGLTDPITTGREETLEERGLIVRKQGEEVKENALDENEVHAETMFREERRKKFAGYKAGIGWIFLVFLLAVLIVTGYQVGIYMVQYSSHSLFDRNLYFGKDIQAHWYALASAFVYYTSSIPSYQIRRAGYIRSFFDEYHIYYSSRTFRLFIDPWLACIVTLIPILHFFMADNNMK